VNGWRSTRRDRREWQKTRGATPRAGVPAGRSAAVQHRGPDLKQAMRGCGRPWLTVLMAHSRHRDLRTMRSYVHRAKPMTDSPARPACCMGRRIGRVEPYPCSGSRDPDILRASKVEHAVQHVGGDGHFGRLPPIGPRAQLAADEALVHKSGLVASARPGPGVYRRAFVLTHPVSASGAGQDGMRIARPTSAKCQDIGSPVYVYRVGPPSCTACGC